MAQRIFIRNVLQLVEGEKTGSAYQSQMVITTHSPHILYERGFQPIRYFRRQNVAGQQTTDVLNLSAFYDTYPGERDFLQRYLKLTHCDLFFADAAILIEGNVERLLLPVMIEQETLANFDETWGTRALSPYPVRPKSALFANLAKLDPRASG